MIAEIILEGIRAAIKYGPDAVASIARIWDDKQTLTVEEARARVQASLEFAARQALRDEKMILERVK